MENLEKNLRKRTRNKNIQKIILKTVEAAGVLAVALLAPNALQALKQVGLLPKPHQREIFNSSRHRLVKTGLLIYENGFLRLTVKGRKKLQQLERRDYKLVKPKRWDKKWRILIFDIPERQRILRTQIRRTILSVGFMKLQKSVWVYPYDCEELVTLLKTDQNLRCFVLYVTGYAIEFDKPLRQHFSLSLE